MDVGTTDTWHMNQYPEMPTTSHITCLHSVIRFQHGEMCSNSAFIIATQ